MSHMVKKGIVFKKDDGTIFIIDRVLDVGMGVGFELRTQIMAKAITRNSKQYVRMSLNMRELKQYIGNLNQQDIDKLNLLGIKYYTDL